MIRLQKRYVLSYEGELSRRVSDLTRKFIDMWWVSDINMPELERTYSLREKLDREALFRNYLKTLDAASKAMALGEAERLAAKERIRQATRDFAKTALDFNEQQYDEIISYGFLEADAEFIRASRRYDSSLSDADIFQASRNVWSMNLMQLLLGRPVSVTPSVFAYSLLYPYSDNYLDDPSIPIQTKITFSQRFQRRLEGQPVNPANLQEATISELISRIESEYNRDLFPAVYESLLAIHNAQSKSLQLIRPNASPFEVDILGLCFEKGGASVLADGYLVGGQLTPVQEEFMFYYGTFTQLFDDLEDVQADLEKGLNTVYSLTARHWPLDEVTNRTFHFWNRVMRALQNLETPLIRPLIEAIGKTLPMLLVAEIGIARQYYTRSYIREMEAHCPFRFSFLIEERQRLQRRGISLQALVEAMAR